MEVKNMNPKQEIQQIRFLVEQILKSLAKLEKAIDNPYDFTPYDDIPHPLGIKERDRYPNRPWEDKDSPYNPFKGQEGN